MRIEKATARDLPEVLALHAALTIAREHHVDAVFLLTTTAEQFFPKFGFERISRADVPASVQASVEFQSACPASATVMRKWIPSGR